MTALRTRSRTPGFPIAAAAVVLAGAVLVIDAAGLPVGAGTHGVISALPLALIALGYLAHQPARRTSASQGVKAGLLSLAFALWAATQIHPGLPIAVTDLAIGLFVLDLAWIIRAEPAAPHATMRD